MGFSDACPGCCDVGAPVRQLLMGMLDLPGDFGPGMLDLTGDFGWGVSHRLDDRLGRRRRGGFDGFE